VRIAPGEVLSPDVPEPDVLVAFNAPSLARFGPEVRPGGVVVYDRSVIQAPPPLAQGVTCVAVPCSEIALALGSPKVKNVVALGALEAAAGLFGEPEWLESIEEALKKKASLAALNEEAFRRGLEAGRALIAPR
jgi:Pyruvate/2-oxoacid:ferredoxin oxidoreductase gamma subunit